MKKILYFFVIALITSSCSYTVYNMNRGELKIAKKDTYKVNYVTNIPPGTTATITYINKNNTTHTEELYKGSLNKTVELPSGSAVKFTVDVKLPQTDPVSKLETFVKVDGEIVSEQIQTGKGVKYRFEFKLP